MSKKVNSYEEMISKTVVNEISKYREISKKMPNGVKIPQFITQNLSNILRPYQVEALENFLFVNNKEHMSLFNVKAEFKHNIFHMATGSGKTMMMAGTILYLYSLGYRKFLFLTQSLNLIEKTKNNLLPHRDSSKLEFNKNISINGKEVKIKEVEKFSDENDDIEIAFKTVHSVHNEIQIPKENSIDYTKNKIAILADEAHHFQANQKGKSEQDEKTWESSINTMLNSHPENRLYEFTATLELKHAEIHEKYKDKIIYDYPLLKFRKDGYSKEVTLIRMNDHMEKDRVLLSIITSQYRYHVASEKGISLVPRILFKGQGTTEELDSLKEKVQSYIQGLDLNTFNSLLKKYKDFKIFNLIGKDFTTDEDKEKFINKLKIMMDDSSMISVHSKNPKREKERLLQELNKIDENKSYRLIFAINILNEGWDVLSLFDIVKMDKANANTKETTQEAQLIGRGARQFPYEYEDKDKYKRKFDGEIHDKLRILEEMFFYSTNDNKYIEALRQSLAEIGLQDLEIDDIKDIKTVVNQRNKLNNLLKVKGSPKIFTNKLLGLEDNIKRLPDYFDGKKTLLTLNYDLQLGEESILDNGKDFLENVQGASLNDLIKGNEFIFQRIIRKLDLANKGKHEYSSYSDLMSDLMDNKVNQSIEIKITNGKDGFNSLNYDDKFNIGLSIVNKMLEFIQSYKGKMYGSEELNVVKSIEDVFKEYTKSERFCLEYGQTTVKEFHLDANRKPLSESSNYTPYCIKNKDLFYYDKVTWDSKEELELYQYLDRNIPKSAYENILIIRNENENFKVFHTGKDLSDEKLGMGFCPDFIILKRVNEELHIFFIEVKGQQETQEWKKVLMRNLLKGKTKKIDGIIYKVIGIDDFCTSDNRDSLIKGSGLLG